MYTVARPLSLSLHATGDLNYFGKRVLIVAHELGIIVNFVINHTGMYDITVSAVSTTERQGMIDESSIG